MRGQRLHQQGDAGGAQDGHVLGGLGGGRGGEPGGPHAVAQRGYHLPQLHLHLRSASEREVFRLWSFKDVRVRRARSPRSPAARHLHAALGNALKRSAGKGGRTSSVTAPRSGATVSAKLSVLSSQHTRPPCALMKAAVCRTCIAHPQLNTRPEYMRVHKKLSAQQP